jgi:hypothetical protein
MKPKDKLVSFRISHDEYFRLRDACSKIGARNISELARTAMQRMVDVEESAADGLQDQVLGIRSKLDHVSRDFERLARTVGS